MRSNYLSELERKIIFTTQKGIPLDIYPYEKIALDLGITEDRLLQILQDLKARGIIRRIALVPNHYRLGYLFNGMTVWEILPDAIDEVGRLFSQLPYVSHCYRRKIYPGIWNYNLFAMIHGQSKDECNLYMNEMKQLIKNKYLNVDVLYSTRILKKTGLRIKD